MHGRSSLDPQKFSPSLNAKFGTSPSNFISERTGSMVDKIVSIPFHLPLIVIGKNVISLLFRPPACVCLHCVPKWIEDIRSLNFVHFVY